MISADTRTTQHADQAPVLCVNLNRALIGTDLLWESVLALLRGRPHLLFAFPVWLLRGKAHFKRQVAMRANLGVAYLPIRDDVLAFLREEKGAGREIILVTDSDYEAAVAVAARHDLFSDMMASDSWSNLSGADKVRTLNGRFGGRGYDYIGSGSADLHVWRGARAALLVDPSEALLVKVSEIARVERVFTAKRDRLAAVYRALRCYQWVKNILVFVPLLVSHKLFHWPLLGKGACAFAAFSFAASAVYIVNDLFDLSSDRQHPKKKLRPFASGRLSIPAGVLLSLLMFFAAGLVSALTMPPLFIAELGLYVVLTTAYSVYLKTAAVADLITLACLYTLRILAGGAATGVPISTWLLGFSMFLFLCLAFAKRYAELNVLQVAVNQQAPGRAYHPGDKSWISSTGIASGYLSVLVLALYISSREVVELYRYPQALWLICPPLLYWVSRIWFLAQRGRLDDDPIVFTMKDPVSYAVGAVVAAVMAAGL